MTSITTADETCFDGEFSMFDSGFEQMFDLNLMGTDDLIEHDLEFPECIATADSTEEPTTKETAKDDPLTGDSTTVDSSEPDAFFDSGSFDEYVEEVFGDPNLIPGTSHYNVEKEVVPATEPVIKDELIASKAEEATTVDDCAQDLRPAQSEFVSLDEIDIIKSEAHTASERFRPKSSGISRASTLTPDTNFNRAPHTAYPPPSSVPQISGSGRRMLRPVVKPPLFHGYPGYGQSPGFFLSQSSGQPHMYQANRWPPSFPTTITGFNPAVSQVQAPYGFYSMQPDGYGYSYLPHSGQTIDSPSDEFFQSPTSLGATYKSRDSSLQPQMVPVSTMASHTTPLTGANQSPGDSAFSTRASFPSGGTTTPGSLSKYNVDAALAGNELTRSKVESTDVCRVNPKYTRHQDYIPLPKAPQPWSCFRYTLAGELDPRQVYTFQEIRRFLFANPLHHGRDSSTSDLQLFIHRCPAASNHRYPSKLSHRCRFFDCCLPTINQGQYAVAFDERSASNQDLDPFIVSGYVHLYCLEKFLDFPIICATLNIKPDNRSLPFEKYGISPMRLAATNEREHLEPTSEEILVEAFIASCRDRTLTGYPSPLPSNQTNPKPKQPGRPYEDTLCHRLSLLKLKTETRALSRQRKKREIKAGYCGSSLAAHLGDLETEKDLRRRTRRHENQNQLVGRVVRRRRFGRAAVGEDGEGEEGGESVEGDEGVGVWEGDGDEDEAAYEDFVERQLRAAIAATDQGDGNAKRKRKAGGDNGCDHDDHGGGGYEPATKLPRLEDGLVPE